MLDLRVVRILGLGIGTLCRQLQLSLSCRIMFNESGTGRLQDLTNLRGKAPTVGSGNGHPRFSILTKACRLRICLLGLFFTLFSVTLS